jgi:hypothetical protein
MPYHTGSYYVVVTQSVSDLNGGHSPPPLPPQQAAYLQGHAAGSTVVTLYFR